MRLLKKVTINLCEEVMKKNKRMKCGLVIKKYDEDTLISLLAIHIPILNCSTTLFAIEDA